MSMIKKWITIASVISVLGCGGADHPLVYFPPPPEATDTPAQPSIGAERATCTIIFTSQLCVMLKGDNVDVGTKPEDPLCVEVDPFPLHISGTTITMEGSEFPDIPFEGHGLPAPIMINGKGKGTGKENVGSGTIDAAGNILIDNFSIFINALSMSAEIPDLTLTTGTTPEFPDLQALTGKSPDPSGAMTLVTGTVLGSLFEAADEVLKGASLTASFTGAIEPTLSSCSGSQGERSVEVTKIAIDTNGAQTEASIPEEKRMEVSSGTFIADTSDDVGSSYEATTTFRVTNTSSQPLALKLSPQVGPFFLNSLDPLTRTLESQQSFLVKITFRPRAGEVEPGEVRESLMIGQDLFELVGIAREASGTAEVDVVADDGSVAAGDVDTVNMGETGVAATMERGFFSCQKVQCGNHDAFTRCTPCSDPTTEACELLPLTNSGKPFGEVDAQCALARPDDTPLFTIDLQGTAAITIPGGRKVIALRNRGVTDLTIESVSIDDGEFTIPEGGISVADSLATVGTASPTTLPLTLPPFQPGVQETTAYILIVYQPRDLRGSQGDVAGVGSAATDRAVLTIVTSEQTLLTDLEGATTILEVPALELHFKTSVGDRAVADGESYPLQGITTTTSDLAVPLFLRVPDTAPSAMRVTAISIEGDDAEHFQWLDTADASSDLRPVDLSPPGFDMAPGAGTIETMPFVGYVNFHRGDDQGKKVYATDLTVTAQELDTTGNPARNPDGSIKTSNLSIRLLAALNPLQGPFVLRVTQTMSTLLNPQFPSVASVAAHQEMAAEIEAGRAAESDIQIFTAAIILDPFDEATIMDSRGEEVMSTPGDGMTAVFRALDTHPISDAFEDQFLYDYANLVFDGSRPEGERGVYEDYPNVPEATKTNGWRIFTTILSYPGPLAPLDQRPLQPSHCEVVDPCSQDGFKQFTPAGVAAVGSKGACAFFYASAGRYDSPAFHTPAEMPGGVHTNLCNVVDQPQQIMDANTGRSTVDGHITVEEMGLRFFGPTFVHNPFGPIGNVPPLDVVFHLAFTSGTLKPQSRPSDPNVLPDEHIDQGKQMYKINLDDPHHANPAVCSGNTDNRRFGGKTVSSWRYLAPLLSKDEDGKIPAGCPEDGNDFDGGVAFLHGRPVDPDTRAATFVAASNFGSGDDLTFAFKDVMVFTVINGWLCDPNGDPEQFEGARCFDASFNERDAIGQISAIEEE